MTLTFVHACGESCPVNDRELAFSGDARGHLNEYLVPDARCAHTNKKLQLVAVDGNRDI